MQLGSKSADLALGEIRLQVEMVMFPGNVIAEAIYIKESPGDFPTAGSKAVGSENK